MYNASYYIPSDIYLTIVNTESRENVTSWQLEAVPVQDRKAVLKIKLIFEVYHVCSLSIKSCFQFALKVGITASYIKLVAMT